MTAAEKERETVTVTEQKGNGIGKGQSMKGTVVMDNAFNEYC